jgi:hypothetical protein
MSSAPLLVVALNLGTALHGEPPTDDLSDAVARYQKSCAGSATVECKRLQWQIEGGLYSKLRTLMAATGQGLEGEVLRISLEAETPQLKAFALRRMPQRASADLLPLVLAAFDSPYAMVREPALSVLRQTDARYARYGDRHLANSNAAFPIADPVPDTTALGGPLYPGAKYRPFASNQEIALFSTADPPDKVLAFYAKGNRKALTAAELNAEMKKKATSMSDPMAMMEAVKKAQAEGRNPQDAIMAMQKEMMGGGVNSKAFEGKPGVLNARYVALNDAGSKRVLIFQDDILGGTSLVFFLTSPEAERATTAMGQRTNDMMLRVQMQQLLHQPLIESEN